VTPKRLAVSGVIVLVALMAYTLSFPRMVAAGRNPPVALGWVLGALALGLLLASLVSAIVSPPRRS